MTKGKLVMWSGAGAVAMYFLDPERGRDRRTQVQNRVVGLFNRGTETAGSGGQSETTPSSADDQHRGPQSGMDQTQPATEQAPATTAASEHASTQPAVRTAPSGNANES
jgi:hypothetical protein